MYLSSDEEHEESPDNLVILKWQQTAALTAVTKCRNDLSSLMADDGNLPDMKLCLAKLEGLVLNFTRHTLTHWARLQNGTESTTNISHTKRL